MRPTPARRRFVLLAIALSTLAQPSAAVATDVFTQFEGLANSDNVGRALPPDDNLAAGPSHLFEMVNEHGRVSDKAGLAIQSFSLRTFFGVDSGFDSTDPQVLYDAASGRWFATYNQSSATGATASSIILAVSSTGDPTGMFCRYRLGHPTSESFLQDQPLLGVSDDKVIVSYNAFSGSGDLFLGAGYYVINKGDLVACSASIGVVRMTPDLSKFSLHPAQSLSSTGTLYMVENDGSSLLLVSVSGVPGVSGVTATSRTFPIRRWNAPPQAEQAGSSVLLDTGDDRVQSVSWQNGSLWLGGNESCTPPGDSSARSCLRLIELRTDTASVRQDMTFGASGQHYYYPALRPDSRGNLLVVFTESSSSDFASVRTASRLASDPMNTLQPSQLLRAGGGAQTHSSGRMGDYSGAAVDPVQPFTIWVCGEYIRSTASADWGTYIAQLAFPNPSLSLGLNRSTVASGDTVQVSITGMNPGGADVVDLYFVMLVPPATSALLGCPGGDAVVFIANAFSKMPVACAATAPIQTFEPLYRNVPLPARMPPMTVSSFFSAIWPKGVPAGTYTFAILATPPLAFADGVFQIDAFAEDSFLALP